MIIDNISMALKLKQLEIPRCPKIVSVVELFGFRKKNSCLIMLLCQQNNGTFLLRILTRKHSCISYLKGKSIPLMYKILQSFPIFLKKTPVLAKSFKIKFLQEPSQRQNRKMKFTRNGLFLNSLER